MVGKLVARIKRHGIPIGILAVSLAASVVGWKAARDQEYHEAQAAFIRVALSYQHQLERRMAVDFRFLADLSGLLETNDHITYPQFEHYVDHVNAMMGVRSIRYVGYLPLRGSPAAAVHAVLAPDSQTKMTGSNALGYVYSDSGSAQQQSLSAGVLDDPASRDAQQKARDWGKVVATGKMGGMAGRDPPTFLLFAPVYREPPQPHTVAQRRAAIKGFVYEAFQTDDLLRAAWGEHFEEPLDVRFAVEGTSGGFSTIYDSITPNSPGDYFLYTGRFPAAGREWKISLRSSVKGYMNPVEVLPLAILLGGIFISLLLTAISTMWDVRRRTAKCQQVQNQRFRSLFDQNPDAVYSLDLNGRFTSANKQSERLAGKPVEQLLNLSARDVIAPDKREESSKRLEMALQGHTTYGETAIAKKNGERIELAVTHVPIVVDGKLEGVFGIAKDITARKRTEAALQKAHTELEDRVQERTLALRQEVEARKQTEATLRHLASHLQGIREDERTRIAREIHDELGGVLAAIKFDLSVPMRQGSQCSEQALQRGQDLIHLVDEAITSLRRIISDLRPSILDDLGLWATLDWLAHEFEGRMGIPVLFDLEGEEVEIPPARATALFRIVQESLNNVAKHAQASQVEILATTTAHSISIVIQDNGQGFAPNATSSSKSYGILGMRERAQAFNGFVEITSQPGKGTAVSIEFPV